MEEVTYCGSSRVVSFRFPRGSCRPLAFVIGFEAICLNCGCLGSIARLSADFRSKEMYSGDSNSPPQPRTMLSIMQGWSDIAVTLLCLSWTVWSPRVYKIKRLELGNRKYIFHNHIGRGANSEELRKWMHEQHYICKWKTATHSSPSWLGGALSVVMQSTWCCRNNYDRMGTSKSAVQKDEEFEVVSFSNLMAVKETPE